MAAAPSVQKKPATLQKFEFGPWVITSCKSHILESDGDQRGKFERELALPQLPEMVFPENYLRIQHQSGSGIEFNAFDALRVVDAHSDPVKVAASREWQGARFVGALYQFTVFYTEGYKIWALMDRKVQ